jgi:2C-methyl-D-erythritol 2,4-cyclodiphosphate synthase
MSRFNSFVCIKKSLKIPKIISQKWALQNMTKKIISQKWTLQNMTKKIISQKWTLQNMTKKIISQKWTLQNMTKKKNNHQQIRLHRKLKIK